MKTRFIFVTTLIINTFLSIAQTGIEVSVGPLFSNVTLKGVNQALRPSRTLHTGLQAQLLWNQSIDGNWSVKSGVAYKEKGFVWNESIHANVLNIPLKVGVSATTSMNYIEIPLHLHYKIGNENGIKAAAFIGPNIGYALNGDIRTRANMLFDFNPESSLEHI